MNGTKHLARLAKLLACLAIGFGVMLKPVFAAPIFVAGAQNEINFSMVQNLYDVDGNGVASIGDTLYGLVNVTRIMANGSVRWDANNVPATTIDSFSGYFLGSVTSVTVLPYPWAAVITLGPAASDPNGLLTSAELAAQVGIKLFTDSGTPFESNGTVADDILKATDGAFWGSLGFSGGYWNGVAMANGVVYAYGGMNFVAKPGDLGAVPMVDPGCAGCPAVDVRISSVMSDSGGTHGWRYTGSNIAVAQAVPEPGMGLLFMTGLLVMVIGRKVPCG